MSNSVYSPTAGRHSAGRKRASDRPVVAYLFAADELVAMSEVTDEADGSDRIPVTVLTGPLGAGKTTLVNHLLREAGDRSIAVVVNDMGEINVDAELIEGEVDEEIVDLSNGCICCRLQGDLLSAIDRLARERTFDHLAIEASGISEPMPIARTLTLGEADSDIDPTDRYRLDTVVTVVDTYGF